MLEFGIDRGGNGGLAFDFIERSVGGDEGILLAIGESDVNCWLGLVPAVYHCELWSCVSSRE